MRSEKPSQPASSALTSSTEKVSISFGPSSNLNFFEAMLPGRGIRPNSASRLMNCLVAPKMDLP